LKKSAAPVQTSEKVTQFGDLSFVALLSRIILDGGRVKKRLKRIFGEADRGTYAAGQIVGVFFILVGVILACWGLTEILGRGLDMFICGVIIVLWGSYSFVWNRRNRRILGKALQGDSSSAVLYKEEQHRNLVLIGRFSGIAVALLGYIATGVGILDMTSSASDGNSGVLSLLLAFLTGITGSLIALWAWKTSLSPGGPLTQSGTHEKKSGIDRGHNPTDKESDG
jgi:hypothetical protein